jgi:hypothetical protein
MMNEVRNWPTHGPRNHLFLTRHAQKRRKQMGVNEDQITAAVLDAETIYPGGSWHPEGRTCYQRGELVVVMCDETGEVVTLLWHGKEGR